VLPARTVSTAKLASKSPSNVDTRAGDARSRWNHHRHVAVVCGEPVAAACLDRAVVVMLPSTVLTSIFAASMRARMMLPSTDSTVMSPAASVT